MSLAINGTDGIDFNADDAKIKLGAGDDLEIFHDGSNSYIKDVGTGGLIVTTDSLIQLQKGTSEILAKFTPDGAVELNYDNSKKFETTSAGATVTGTLTATLADNSVGLAQMAGGTDGQIITYDASGDPVAVGPGTDGQVLTSTGSGSPPAFEDVPAGGITQADHWRTNSDVSGNQLPLTNLEQVDSYGFGSGSEIGSGMSQSSGVFTFPATGIWLIIAQLSVYSDNHSQKNNMQIQYTSDNGSNWVTNANMAQGIYDQGSDSYGAVSCSVLLDITNVSNDKVKFNFSAGQGGETCQGHTVYNHTHFVFIRLGDT